MAKSKTSSKRKNNTKPKISEPAAGASTIGASTVHEGARYYQKLIRTSEVLGNNNLDPRQIVTEFDRWNLSNKSRFFVENIPAVKGAIEEISTYAIGNGFDPIYQGEDDEWGDLAEEWLRNWYNIADRNGSDFKSDLWMASCAIDRDGDSLMYFTTNTAGDYPRIQLIPAHRIQTVERQIKEGPFAGLECYDGVIFNKNQQAVAYNVLTSELGQTSTGPNTGNENLKCTQIPVWKSHLIFESKYPLQFRGFPAMATSINYWMDIRDIFDYEREAIKQAASVALIEKNEVGGALPGQYQFGMTGSMQNQTMPNQPLFYKYYNQGLIRYFSSNDPNSGLQQMVNNRPGGDTREFVLMMMRGCFNSIGWPHELYDTTDLNSANTRAILAKVQRKLTQRQSTVKKVWMRCTLYALAKAIKMGLLPESDDWYKWDCSVPPSPSIDLGRDAKTDIEYYKVGANTLADIYGKNGQNWEDKIRQICKEKARIKEIAKEYGVDPNEIQILTPNGNMPTGQDPEETTEESEDSEDKPEDTSKKE